MAVFVQWAAIRLFTVLCEARRAAIWLFTLLSARLRDCLRYFARRSGRLFTVLCEAGGYTVVYGTEGAAIRLFTVLCEAMQRSSIRLFTVLCEAVFYAIVYGTERAAIRLFTVLCEAGGYTVVYGTLPQRLERLTSPSADWGPALPRNREMYLRQRKGTPLDDGGVTATWLANGRGGRTKSAEQAC